MIDKKKNSFEKRYIIPKYFYGWNIVGASTLCYSASPGQFAAGALGLFTISLETEFGWSRTEIAFAISLFTLTQALLNPILGKMIDARGAKQVLVPTYFMFGLLLATLPLVVTELWHLYVIFIAIGVVGGGCSAIPYLRFASAWFNKRRGLALGITMAGGGLGYTYVAPLSRYMIDNHGWRSGYLALAAIVIFIGIPIIYLVLKNKPADMGLLPDNGVPEDSIPSKGTPETEIPFIDVIRNITLWKLFAVFTLMTFCLYGLMFQFVPMLEGRGMDSANAAIAFSLIGTTMVFARIGIGYLLDKIYAPKLATICILLSALGVVILATGTSGPQVYVAALLLGLSIGAELDLLAYLITKYFGLGSFGMIYGVLFGAFLIGVTTGGPIYAASFDYFGSYINILVIATGLLVVSAFMMLRLPRYET